ncbi:hypothetical protein G7074_08160 [Pedobacter sp. HDW13]|uniref:DUF6702 family protein n=1 Tax=unclassified Pedobacter TaxID=2628915 RepID=UPI000F5967B5|nr:MULTISPECIES: DUF6702 family protein [unclassified Pedobacter]QIL39250.1 hypothetical protein G7074_08160 [Pedobacter sp. HDW13]RQO65659.1 hypothetical protein DBR40_23060 [Pedobacter sp. KBW01]
MRKLKFVVLLLCCTFFAVEAGIKHPLHVSTTEVNFNAKDKTLEISCKIFSDDFESILARLYKQKTDLSNPNMKNAMDELVKKYLLSHLQVKANGKVTTMNYIGFEIDHEATNIYMEVEKISAVKSIEINNTILYDLFDDQMSIVHIVKGPVRKSSKILYPEKKFVANF